MLEKEKETESLKVTLLATGKNSQICISQNKQRLFISQQKMKDVIISTSGLNSYGSRVLTEGIDLAQYKRNPIILWMHRRCWEGDSMPIGRMTNIRKDGDLLIGTPEFDMNDEFAKKIAQKWDKDFLRMASAGIEIKEVSVEPSMLVPGQTRPTVTKSKLVEVSIVDIGANDDALRLMKGGKVLTLASGEECDVLPLLAKPAEPATKAQERQNDNNNTINNNENMNEKINLALGLSKDATEAEALAAIVGLQSKAKEVETLQLAAITSAVNVAIAEKRITEANRDHFVNLGKKVGIESLQATLQLMQPAVKPTDVIKPSAAPQPATFAKGKTWDELDREGKLLEFKAQDFEGFKAMYKSTFGEDYVG